MPGTERVVRAPSFEADLFRQMFDRYYPAVWSYCARRLPRSEVDDAAADVFATAWRRRSDVPDEPATLPWLYRVAHYTVAHVVRARQRRGRLFARLAGSVEHEAPTATSQLHGADDSIADVVAAVDTLAARDRELVRLLAWERLSYDEIGVALGCSVNAVAIRVHRVRARLARALKANGATGHSATWQATTQGDAG